MNKENKDNIPEDCRHCANDKDCYTYYGSNVCQNHWLTRELSDVNKWVMETIMELSQEEKDETGFPRRNYGRYKRICRKIKWDCR